MNWERKRRKKGMQDEWYEEEEKEKKAFHRCGQDKMGKKKGKTL